MAQERARLAREQAEAEAAIPADNKAVQPTHMAKSMATKDIPGMLNLESTSAMPSCLLPKPCVIITPVLACRTTKASS